MAPTEDSKDSRIIHCTVLTTRNFLKILLNRLRGIRFAPKQSLTEKEIIGLLSNSKIYLIEVQQRNDACREARKHFCKTYRTVMCLKNNFHTNVGRAQFITAACPTTRVVGTRLFIYDIPCIKRSTSYNWPLQCPTFIASACHSVNVSNI